MTVDQQQTLVFKTKDMWEAYTALGALVPIDDPAHHLLKRLNVEMEQLYLHVVTACDVNAFSVDA